MISLPFLVSPLQHFKIHSPANFTFTGYYALGGWPCRRIFSVVERLVWVNADSYPSWLAKELDSPTITDGETFIKATESFEKTAVKLKVLQRCRKA